MLVKLQAQDPALDWTITAVALSAGGSLCKGLAEAKETLDYMLDAIYCYKNLEAHAGAGVTFLLGTGLSESW